MRSLLRFGVFVVAVVLAVAMVFWIRDATHRAVPLPIAGPVTERPALERYDEEFADLVASVLPSVVSIDAIPPDAVDPRLRMLKLMLGAEPGQTFPQVGSGVIVSEDGYIVTNHHVIEGAAAARVHLNDGRMLPARLVGSDPASDIAILRIEAGELLPIGWGDSDKARVGQGVFAVGNPLGLQETVTRGIISGKGRRASSEAANEFFQTDAAINQGNSGGPLLNLRGELIGINNMVMAGGEGIAFAIPSNTVRRVYQSIRDYGRFVRPWFGAIWRPLTPALATQLGLPLERGALLLGTYENSPAAAAGLLPGDVVTEFNNRPILDHIDLRNRVAECDIGQEVPIAVNRMGNEFRLSARITAEP